LKARLAGLVLVALGSALLMAPGAGATTVTVGSPLTLSFDAETFGSSRSLTNFTLAEPGAMPTAPANGTITSWKVLDASGGPLKLRVVHPLGGNLFVGGGTALSGPITGLGLTTFTARLPIKAGDYIGLDPTANSDAIGGNFTTPGSTFIDFGSPLVDGSPVGSPGDTPVQGEAAFNAQVLLNCIVPKVKGKKVSAARRALANAGCATPTIKKKGKTKKIIKKQNPAPGTEIPGDQATVLKLKPKG
jgi:hypothetical protein